MTPRRPIAATHSGAHARAFPTILHLLAAGSTLLSGGALTGCVKSNPDDHATRPRESTSTTGSASAAESASGSVSVTAAASRSTADSVAAMAPPSSSASLVASGPVASCSASLHVFPHILPSIDNHNMAGGLSTVDTSSSDAPQPTTSVGACAGASNVADADAMIARNRWRFQACYHKAFVADPTTKGTLRVSVHVDAEGNASATVATSSAPASLNACVVASFSTIRFAAPTGGAGTFSVSIDFSPSR